MVRMISLWARWAAGLGAFAVLVGSMTQAVRACTTVLAGKRATADGSVLMASSCDGDVMGLIHIMPPGKYAPGAALPMYRNVPRPTNYEQYQANLRKGYDLVGSVSLSETYRTILLAGNVESMTTGGLNEHGVSIAIEFLPMRAGLACARGVVGPNSNHWSTSLIAHGLMRARTAREAIQVIGSMVEQYGFLYYRAAGAGVALPISDAREAWLMEIFGPGKEWTPESGKPGGVWCAQRIPDGEVGCSANRSRIAEVNVGDTGNFLASPNVFSLAQDLGFWTPGQPLVWCDVYGDPGSRQNSLREWRALSLVAPSLKLSAIGDPIKDRYPFSVKPDRPIDVAALVRLMRDGYEGTPHDLTENPSFQVQGRKSPLARPWGPDALFELLGIQPERAVCTPSSGYVFVAQLRETLPAPVSSCLWFAYGPANTSCFVPVYAGVTRLPDSWDHPANFTRIDRAQPQWNFRLVHNLTNTLRYQDAVKDVQLVILSAEERFMAVQPELERTAARLWEERGAQAVEAFVNEYAARCMTHVGYAYNECVDYLMFKHLVGDSELARPVLPRVADPVIPETGD